MRKRRKFSPEFKREAVKLTQQPGVSCSQIALEIGVAPNLLSRWKREAESTSDKAFQGSGNPRDEGRLRRWAGPRIEPSHGMAETHCALVTNGMLSSPDNLGCGTRRATGSWIRLQLFGVIGTKNPIGLASIVLAPTVKSAQS